MDSNSKQALKQLIWSMIITAINGLITIFNPSTKEVAVSMMTSFMS